MPISKFLLLLFTCVVVLGRAEGRVDGARAPEKVAGQYLVSFPGDSRHWRSSLERGQARLLQALPFGYALVQLEKRLEEEQAQAHLIGLGARTVQPNFVYRLQNPLVPLGIMLTGAVLSSCGKTEKTEAAGGGGGPGNDKISAPATDFERQWALSNPRSGADIRAIPAWDFLRGNPLAKRKVRVAIIDSGIDIKNKEFAGRIDFVHSYNFVGGNKNIQDYNGHGTHVAGIIGAAHDDDKSLKGVNPNVELVVLKAFTMYGIATSADILKAVNAAIKAKVRVINASYGGSYKDDAALKAYGAAGTAGILVVAAGGNSAQNTDEKPSYPAGYELPNILSVGATDRSDVASYFSNFGARTVHVFAPGSEIYSSMVHRRFVNPRPVLTMSLDESSPADWELQRSSGMVYPGQGWSLGSCPEESGRCLVFQAPADYTPSDDFEFFEAELNRETPSSREKRYTVHSLARFHFVRINWEKNTGAAVIAGQSNFWMLQGHFFSGLDSPWQEHVADISEPGFFYSGTSAWDRIRFGYHVSFSDFQNSTEHRATNLAIKRFSLVSEDPAADSGLEAWSGTSMAAPHVVGIAAWILALNPALTPEQVRARIIQSCDPVGALGGKAVCGGRVNLLRAVRN